MNDKNKKINHKILNSEENTYDNVTKNYGKNELLNKNKGKIIKKVNIYKYNIII